jgi:hypothetical protein
VKAAVVTIVTLAVFFLVIFIIPRILTKRAARKVIARFRKQGALSPETAVTLRALKLDARRPWENMFRLRDYKPLAARLMAQAHILHATEDDRVYLSEEDLQKSPLKKFANLE